MIDKDLLFVYGGSEERYRSSNQAELSKYKIPYDRWRITDQYYCVHLGQKECNWIPYQVIRERTRMTIPAIASFGYCHFENVFLAHGGVLGFGFEDGFHDPSQLLVMEMGRPKSSTQLLFRNGWLEWKDPLGWLPDREYILYWGKGQQKRREIYRGQRTRFNLFYHDGRTSQIPLKDGYKYTASVEVSSCFGISRLLEYDFHYKRYCKFS